MNSGRQLEKPHLVFFRDTPEGMMNRPPLASSLQHLDTSFLLLSMGRYPHALVSCGSAIESALKAAINAGPESRLEFKELINKARLSCPSLTLLNDDAIRRFRDKRNEIIHYGFSPKDDELSAKLLLETGYTLLENCYDAFFQFMLVGKNDVYGGLDVDLARHLEIARKVYAKAKNEPNVNLTYCFLSLIHQVRWDLRENMLSYWQKEVINSEEESLHEISWDMRKEYKQELSWKVMDPSFDFDCPICGASDDFVCQLDDELLENAQISLKRGACVNCGFMIPKNCPFLADELCTKQIDQAKSTILKEYGIKQ